VSTTAQPRYQCAGDAPAAYENRGIHRLANPPAISPPSMV
jgi:hypothetical protein